jgi:hypothetical protein
MVGVSIVSKLVQISKVKNFVSTGTGRSYDRHNVVDTRGGYVTKHNKITEVIVMSVSFSQPASPNH